MNKVPYMEPFTEEWNEAANRLARSFTPPIHDCKKCGGPVVTQIRVRGKIDGTLLADCCVLGERRGDTAHNAVGRLYIEQER